MIISMRMMAHRLALIQAPAMEHSILRLSVKAMCSKFPTSEIVFWGLFQNP